MSVLQTRSAHGTAGPARRQLHKCLNPPGLRVLGRKLLVQASLGFRFRCSLTTRPPCRRKRDAVHTRWVC